MTLGLAKVVVTYGAPREQKKCLQFMLFAAAVVALSLAGATPAFAQCTEGGEVTFPGALGTFTNKGTLNAGANSTVNIAGGENFTNLSAGTLTGGSYKATGTLQIPGNVTTNAANIMLTGLTSQILNPNTNALTGLLTNTSKGSFTLAGGQNFTTAGTFANQGAISIGKNSTFTVAAGGSYVQTGGKTTVSGELTVAGTTTGAVNINKGFVYGNGGTIDGDLSSSGTVNPGLSIASAGKLTATNHTQSSVGALNANIGGANAGQFGVLNVTGTANLGGVLNIKLLGTFVPLIGATFEILTAGSVHGTFATVNGTAIKSSEHFTVTYNSNNVTLTVVSGA
jgi:hypothetical protein